MQRMRVMDDHWGFCDCHPLNPTGATTGDLPALEPGDADAPFPYDPCILPNCGFGGTCLTDPNGRDFTCACKGDYHGSQWAQRQFRVASRQRRPDFACQQHPGFEMSQSVSCRCWLRQSVG